MPATPKPDDLSPSTLAADWQRMKSEMAPKMDTSPASRPLYALTGERMKPDQQVSEKHPTISDTQRDAFLMQWIRDAISDGNPIIFRQSARTLDPDTEKQWRSLNP